MRFINPKTDYAFKKIFGSAESKDILISFLNALVYDGNATGDVGLKKTKSFSSDDTTMILKFY